MINPVEGLYRRILRRILARGGLSGPGGSRTRLLWRDIFKCAVAITAITALVVALAGYRLMVRYEQLTRRHNPQDEVAQQAGDYMGGVLPDGAALNSLSAEINVPPTALDGLVEGVRELKDARVVVALAPDDEQWLARIILTLGQLIDPLNASLTRADDAKHFVQTFEPDLFEGVASRGLADPRIRDAWVAIAKSERSDVYAGHLEPLGKQTLDELRKRIVYREPVTKADLIRLVVYLRSSNLLLIRLSKEQELVRRFVETLPPGVFVNHYTAIHRVVKPPRVPMLEMDIYGNQRYSTEHSITTVSDPQLTAKYGEVTKYLYPYSLDNAAIFFNGGVYEPFTAWSPPLDLRGAMALCENAARYTNWLAGLSPEVVRPEPELPAAQSAMQALPPPILKEQLQIEPLDAPQPVPAPAPEPPAPSNRVVKPASLALRNWTDIDGNKQLATLLQAEDQSGKIRVNLQPFGTKEGRWYDIEKFSAEDQQFIRNVLDGVVLP